MKTICIMCPMGCSLDIEKIGDEIGVKGNACKRGEMYGIAEFSHPMRSITCLMRIEDGGVCSVKTSSEVPKEKIFEVLDHLKSLTAQKSSKIGDVIEKNALNLGVDIVVTGMPN